MLRSVSELTGYVLLARDGEIGRCKDFLFDDRHWTIRYMVADTGKWLPGRRVLVSPLSLGAPDWEEHSFPVHMTKGQVKEAPPLAEDAPVSRRYESKLAAHHGHPLYWVGPGLWGPHSSPADLAKAKRTEVPDAAGETAHLRSTKEVIGYHIAAADKDIGHVDDFIADDRAWALRYLVVDTRNWLPGKKVLVAPDWAESVSWTDRKVRVGLTADDVEESPEFDPSQPVNREYEERLYDYYGRPTWW